MTKSYDDMVAVRRTAYERTASIVQEHWKVDHDMAEFAWLVSEFYCEALRFFQMIVHVDDSCAEWRGSEARSRALREALPAYRLLREKCEAVDIDAYGYEATKEKAEQLEAMAKALYRGVQLYDSKAEARIVDGATRGEATTLDELERQLRDRRR